MAQFYLFSISYVSCTYFPFQSAVEDVGESWKFLIHPCAHSLFVALLHEYRDIVTPLVLKLLQENEQMVDPHDLNGILRKDAVYCAIGLCTFDLYDEVRTNLSLHLSWV